MAIKLLFSQLLKKAILMVLWTKAFLCGKSSLVEQSLPRTQSRPKTSMISVNPVILSNLSSCLRALRGENLLYSYNVIARKYLRAYKPHSTTVEDSLQIRLFMQNKANFQKVKLNANKAITRVYENMTLGESGKNEPKTNPIKPKFKKTKMNVTSIITKDYENKTPFRAPKKQSQFSKRQKPMQTSLPKGIMKNTAFSGPGKTNPIQTQFKANKMPKQTQPLVKNSCARLWALLQSFQENFDKPGEQKAECSARPKLRTDPMNLLGIMPAKEGKIDLKHSFCRSAFCFMVNGFKK